MTIQMLSQITCACGLHHARVFSGEEINRSSFEDGNIFFKIHGYKTERTDTSWPLHAREPYYIHIMIDGPDHYHAQSFGYTDEASYLEAWNRAQELMNAFKAESIMVEEIKTVLADTMGGNPE